MLKIDPTNMSDDDRYAIGYFFDTKFGEIYIKADKKYTFHMVNPQTGITETKEIIFSHAMVKRSCKPGGKHDKQHRYEVFAETTDNNLGKGTFAKVYKISGTIVPSMNGQLPIYKIKNRLIKILTPIIFDSEKKKVDAAFKAYERMVDSAKNEFQLAPIHLHAKPPTFFKANAFLCLRYMEGNPLSKLINIMREAPAGFPFAVRMNICIAIAEAYEEQVLKAQVVHRDIKPENIIIRYDAEAKKWIVKFIDFGLSKHISTADDYLDHSIGTPLFAAPEAMKCLGTSTKSDVYSLACVFSEIFGCNRELTIDKWDKLEAEWKFRTIALIDFFKEIKHVSDAIKQQVETLLMMMTDGSPFNRPAIPSLTRRLREILEDSESEQSMFFFKPSASPSAAAPTIDEKDPAEKKNPAMQ